MELEFFGAFVVSSVIVIGPASVSRTSSAGAPLGRVSAAFE